MSDVLYINQTFTNCMCLSQDTLCIYRYKNIPNIQQKRSSLVLTNYLNLEARNPVRVPIDSTEHYLQVLSLFLYSDL